MPKKRKSKKKRLKRPWFITALCIILFLAAIYGIIYTYTGIYSPYGNLYSAIHVFLIILCLAALSGIWNMERWGADVLLILWTGKIIADIAMKAFNPWFLLVYIPVIFFFLYRRFLKRSPFFAKSGDMWE